MLLEELDPDGPALFQKLHDEDELAELRAAMLDAIPTTEEIAATGEEPAKAWVPLRRGAAAALRRAHELLGL